jgi:hypothetical protein
MIPTLCAGIVVQLSISRKRALKSCHQPKEAPNCDLKPMLSMLICQFPFGRGTSVNILFADHLAG